jgi:rhodanese-related sulfurtransferase
MRSHNRRFQHLFNVVGGTSAWVNAGYPVETTSAPTVQVS